MMEDILEEESDVAQDRNVFLDRPLTRTKSTPIIKFASRNCPPAEKVDVNSFEILKVLGTGSYGKVYLVKKVVGWDVGKPYAMKVLKKATIELHGKTEEHTKAERTILESIQKGPFLVKLHYAFQTNDKLHLILDYVSGGELFTHHSRLRSFSEDEARLYIAEVTLALAHLHSLGIIYRDIKLENILLDSDGHVVLTDFGLSKEMWSEGERAFSYVGTMEYMAPEIAADDGQDVGHTKAVDWWSLGILLYELIYGRTPFAAKDDSENANSVVLQGILYEEPDYRRSEASADSTLIDLIEKLLIKVPENRMGYGLDDAKPIKGHAFFKCLDWDLVKNKQYAPPFRPRVGGETDTSNFDREFTDMDPRLSTAPPTFEGKPRLFRGFSFVAPSVLFDSTALFQGERPAQSSSAQFKSKYKLLEVTIGVGSFSICKKCIRLSDNKEFACKIISTRRSDPAREVAILKKCQGRSNIIELVDHFQDELHHYLIMPHMAGGELLDRIRLKTHFTESEAGQIFFKLIEAVQFMHRNGIVHRDIKPENLLYESAEEDAELRIVDFGFAREVVGENSLQTPCFTHGYGAPEVLEHAQPPKFTRLGSRSGSVLQLGGYDKSCDLWSLGVILYTMLSGYPPFHSRANMSTDEMLKKIKEAKFTFPDEQWKDVSQEAKDLVTGLLTVNASERLSADEAAIHPWVRATSKQGLSSGLGRNESSLPSPAILNQTSEGLFESAYSSSRKRLRPENFVAETLETVQFEIRQGNESLLAPITNAKLVKRRKGKIQKQASQDDVTAAGLPSSSILESAASEGDMAVSNNVKTSPSQTQSASSPLNIVWSGTKKSTSPLSSSPLTVGETSKSSPVYSPLTTSTKR
eukprot:m.209899 g.209899  ORF g.209899 m.209899 type:complete len:865 (+) comp33055_c0_seq1:152-2746(+)